MMMFGIVLVMLTAVFMFLFVYLPLKLLTEVRRLFGPRNRT